MKIITVREVETKISKPSSRHYKVQLDNGEVIRIRLKEFDWIHQLTQEKIEWFNSDFDLLKRDKTVTVKIQETTHTLPNWIPKRIRLYIERKTKKISLIPYWYCFCPTHQNGIVLVFTREKMQENVVGQKFHSFHLRCSDFDCNEVCCPYGLCCTHQRKKRFISKGNIGKDGFD